MSWTFPRKGGGASPSFQQLVWQSKDEFNWRREFLCTIVCCFLDELPGEAHHINKKLHCKGAWLWNPNMAYSVFWRANMSHQQVYSKPGHNWRNVNSFTFHPSMLTYGLQQTRHIKSSGDTRRRSPLYAEALGSAPASPSEVCLALSEPNGQVRPSKRWDPNARITSNYDPKKSQMKATCE